MYLACELIFLIILIYNINGSVNKFLPAVTGIIPFDPEESNFPWKIRKISW